MSWRWLVVLVLSALGVALLASCEGETEFPKGFSIPNFEKIENGDSLGVVTRLLGAPFEVQSYVDLGPGKRSFNVLNKVDPKEYPESASVYHVLVYSRPATKGLDYWVYEIFIDSESEQVSSKQVYKTD